MDSRQTYEKFATYYDLYVGGFAADIPLYKSFCERFHRILEVGCGTGRILKAFLDDGYRITGVDISDEMLAVARGKLAEELREGSLELLNHDFCRSPLKDGYDRVLITFYTFNYLLEDSEQTQFLVNIGKTMAAGSVLMMDLFYPQPLAEPHTSGAAGQKNGQYNRERNFGHKLKKRCQVSGFRRGPGKPGTRNEQPVTSLVQNFAIHQADT